ncbi:hypothetical protein BGW80DRAFT_1192204, partial [Lactifluus volemus]
FYPVTESFGVSTWQVPFLSWQSIIPQLAFFFVFEDMFHYFSHQLLHTSLLYKHIHELYHKYSVPFGLAAEYAHPGNQEEPSYEPLHWIGPKVCSASLARSRGKRCDCNCGRCFFLAMTGIVCARIWNMLLVVRVRSGASAIRT